MTKPNILAKANKVLPANTDLNLATVGFKNFGQFVAAVNVSQNLHMEFADLKLKMTGIPLAGFPEGSTATAGPTMSLGQAIHSINGTVDATAEANKATAQASVETGEQPATTTTTTKKSK